MTRSSHLPALAQGNRFQRWYAAWAEPHYERMKPELRAEAAAVDTFLYSRRGLPTWIGIGCSTLGMVAGLRAAGVPWWAAVLGGVASAFVVFFVSLTAWMNAPQFTWRRSAKVLAVTLLLAIAGMFFGASVSLLTKAEGLPPEQVAQKLVRVLTEGLPILAAVAILLTMVALATAAARRTVMQQALAEARLKQERDAAARQAAEAQLKLLRAQIQPHFIFNTLSALQHWVDTADSRAPALLRALTAFLRSSTELLGRDEVTLADEVAMVRHYLAIMGARLGERLRHEVALDAAVQGIGLPPGVLLTLVENAVEHGVSRALGGGRIEVRAFRETGDGARTCITVRDDGPGLSAPWSEGVGLRNVRERLAHRFGSAATLSLTRLEPQGCCAQVRIGMNTQSAAA
jgi:signal transduction histidine kinase